MASAEQDVLVRSIQAPGGYAAKMSAGTRESDQSVGGRCTSKLAFVNTYDDGWDLLAPKNARAFPNLIEVL
jgi:hypothetical protein